MRYESYATESYYLDTYEGRDITINDETIKFIQPLYEIQDVGTNDSGICEMVIEAAVIYAKKGKQNET